MFADDLNMICEGGELYDMDLVGTKSKMVLLSGDSKDKTFERIMVLFDKFDKIKALSQHFKGLEKDQEKSSGNTFEYVSKKVQAKLNGSK